MESVNQILEKLAQVDVGVKCLQCGAVAMLIGKQYSTRCTVCGTNITLSLGRLAQLKQAEYTAKYGNFKAPRPGCEYCQDTGMVVLKEQVDDYISLFAYKCLCPIGQGRTDIKGWPTVGIEKIRTFQAHLHLVPGA